MIDPVGMEAKIWRRDVRGIFCVFCELATLAVSCHYDKTQKQGK